MAAPQRLLRPLLLALLAASTSAAGCSKITEADRTANRYGAVNITARSATGGKVTANATVIFFEAFSAAVPSSVLQATDQCTYAAVDTGVTVTTGVKKGGENVTLAIAGSTVTLPFEAGLFRYANPAGAPFSYTAGDAVVANVPGASDGFPASSIGVRLAEPLLPGPVTVPAFGVNMTVTWNASTDTTAAILLSLRYANPTSSPYGNEQVFCTLKDDGRFEVPSGGLSAFLAAPNATRSLRLTRWRTRESLLDAKTILHIATAVDTTIRFP